MSTLRNKIYINGTLLRQKRLELGYGLRLVARSAKVSSTVVNTLEKRGFVFEGTPLLELQSIASACGLTLLDLLSEPEAHDDTRESENLDQVAKQLISILIQDPRLHYKTHIAEVLKISLSDLRAVAGKVDEQIKALGLRVHRHNTYIAIRPNDPAAYEKYRQLDKKRLNREEFIISEARLIHQALEGTLSESPSHAEKPYIGRLLRLGILKIGCVGQPLHVLSEEAAFAFEMPGVQIDREYAPSINGNDLRDSAQATTSRSKAVNGRNAGKNRKKKLAAERETSSAQKTTRPSL